MWQSGLSCSVLLLFLTACAGSVGPTKLVSSHEGYNDAVQLTTTREVLKNIVRARYYDPMQFLQVSSVNAQFSVSTGANVGAAGSSGSLGGNVGYSDSPTITYAPLSNAGFAKSLDTPITMQEAVSLAYQWGNFELYELGLALGAINDAVDRGGAAGEHYQRQLQALISLVDGGASLRHFREWYPRHLPISQNKLESLSYTVAAQSDLYFIDAGDGKATLASKHDGVALHVPLPHEGETLRQMQLLGISPGTEFSPMRVPGEAEPYTEDPEEDVIWLIPRSPENMMELAAGTVEVPASHLQQGIASSAGPAANSTVELPLRVRSATEEPAALYRIQHRGYWFYIDDTDAESKRLFGHIVGAYSSRIGLLEARDAAPRVVLPVSR